MTTFTVTVNNLSGYAHAHRGDDTICVVCTLHCAGIGETYLDACSDLWQCLKQRARRLSVTI